MHISDKITYLIIFCFLKVAVAAQDNLDFMFIDAQQYNKNQFDNSLGTPFLFQPWVIAEVFTQSGDIYYPLSVNFNMFSKTWEARRDDQVVNLDPFFFWCIKVYPADNPFNFNKGTEPMVFVRGVIPNKELEYGQLIYNGKRLKLVKAYNTSRTKQNISNEVGATAFYLFTQQEHYYLNIDNKHTKINVLNDGLEKNLSKNKEVKIFLEALKIKPTNESEWIEVLTKIEERFFPI